MTGEFWRGGGSFCCDGGDGEEDAAGTRSATGQDRTGALQRRDHQGQRAPAENSRFWRGGLLNNPFARLG